MSTQPAQAKETGSSTAKAVPVDTDPSTSIPEKLKLYKFLEGSNAFPDKDDTMLLVNPFSREYGTCRKEDFFELPDGRQGAANVSGPFSIPVKPCAEASEEDVNDAVCLAFVRMMHTPAGLKAIDTLVFNMDQKVMFRFTDADEEPDYRMAFPIIVPTHATAAGGRGD